MTFEQLQLREEILRAISGCGYESPTPIQAEAIPLAVQGRDLIASAQTGTGKTAAFVLPALQRLAAPPALRGKGPRVLVLTPTRELATQVCDSVRMYGKFLRVRSGAILGGMPYREQLRLLSQPVDFIVATPGRLIDHLENGRLSLARLELLVLDEADRMLDMGFIEDVERVAAAAPESRQTLLFSATIDKRIATLAAKLLRDPETVRISPTQVTHDNIEQRLLVADNLRHKNRLLRNLVADESLERAIIFSATKKDAEAIARELAEDGHAAAALHGDMTQGARNRAISAMRRGRVRLLVATDVAARGLDVTGISHVINFDLPRFAEDYVHRIGRTGRAGASGVAISFVSQSDVVHLDRIQRYTGKNLAEHTIPGLEPLNRLGAAGRPKGRPGGPASHGRSHGTRAADSAARTGGWKGRREEAMPVVYRKRSSKPMA
ncbi:MAG TPA: DEAD/DEAH box helicase [Verrucomicrobiae bacterium]|nr:DEAD/DEAH box helicase [Verrucomicrobiae bacterium]